MAKNRDRQDIVSFDEIFLIKSKLNRESIKLWLPPYTEADGKKCDIPVELIARFSRELNLPEFTVLSGFEKLRNHAITKLKSIETFKTTGVATLNFHLTWISAAGEKETMDVSLNAKLYENIKFICVRLSACLDPHNFSLENVKMIHKGTILNHDSSLESQNVKNGANIMVMLTLKSVTAHQISEMDVESRVSETKKVAEALAKRVDAGEGKHDHFFLEIRDQQGKKIELPEDERQSLSVALTLHEKGRILMKEKNYMESLLLFLEADGNFSSCRSEILNAVDNYALLCLDIVWCYFSLQKLEHLPDAEEKLKKCKECFTRSYGPNMERLNIVKGNDVNELALFVRVHILEAISAYLRGNTAKATDSLNKAEMHLKSLQIDDDKFSQLVSMGFSPSEARLSLRSCRGDVTVAIEYITRRREERMLRKEQDKKELKDRKLAKKFGKTAAGDLINIDALNNLEEMGFSKKKSADALRQSNNDINGALEALQTDPKLQEIPIPQVLIQQFVTMGFDKDLVRKTLEECDCDPDVCLARLIDHSEKPGSSTGGRSTFSSDEEDEIDQRVKETLKDISSGETEDYLDLELNEEAELVNKYRILIASLQQ